MSDVTLLLSSIENGDERAANELLPLVYEELRRLARHRLANEKQGQTLQATALVHEAYVRLVGKDNIEWNGRGHFFAAAAEAMRRILTERARRKMTEKHGGHFKQIELSTDLAIAQRDEKMVALDAALEKLENRDPLKAKLVKLRFFAGLTNREASAAIGLSTATCERYWAFARAWLQREMRAD